MTNQDTQYNGCLILILIIIAFSIIASVPDIDLSGLGNSILYAIVILIAIYLILRSIKGKEQINVDEKKALVICEKIAKNHKQGLAIERQKLVKLDAYGSENVDLWLKKGIVYFYNKYINPKLSLNQSLYLTSNNLHIKIIDNIARQEQNVLVNYKPVIAKTSRISSSTISLLEINKILEGFKLNSFDPKYDSEINVADNPGNYILCLRKNSKLPTVSITPTMTKFEGLKVIYTGIAGSSLRIRDYRQHFKGNNAGRSTLRKSLGVLFGYKLIPRDKDPNTGKTKFNNHDEHALTEWMHSNLIMFFFPTTDFNNIEIKLINHFNPPLNIKDNHNNINSGFRRLLSNLRAGKN